jgi:hypothetical protein
MSYPTPKFALSQIHMSNLQENGGLTAMLLTTVVLETIKSIFYKLGGAFRSTDTPSQAVVAPSSQ